MKQKEAKSLQQRIEREFLPYVRRPSRYIGGEINQVKKDLSKCDCKIALCFPDIYEIGMSYMGLAIIYDILNKIEGIAAERIFAPWLDAEEIMRRKGIPLFSLESKAALGSFDIVGFSLTNELCYTNVLNMLDLAGIEIRSCNRQDHDPLIIAGGAMANCCEPIAEFIDIFILGEAEETIVELVEFVRRKKRDDLSKEKLLLEIARKFPWAYVPRFYELEYSDGQINSLVPTEIGLNTHFESAVVEDFENASVPLAPIVPFARAVHERVAVEIMRGCPGRCRFCQASFCRRPIRYRSIEKIFDIAKAAYQATGFDTISLLSLSTAEYPNLEQLLRQLREYFADKHVGISLPSLRVDTHLELLPELAKSVRKSGLTIAVESASDVVRRIINKPIDEKALFAAATAAYQAGWKKIKLYFMVGLPGETDEAIKQIVHLSHQISRLGRKINGRDAQINIAISWFVPKPHTPFGWLGQRPADYFEQAKRLILDEKRKLRARNLSFKFHDMNQSVLESAIARGDRKMSGIIEAAWRAGAKFDLWGECFDVEIWQKAFEQFGAKIDAAAQKQFDSEEILPWEHLGGPDKKYLLGHLGEAMKPEPTKSLDESG